MKRQDDTARLLADGIDIEIPKMGDADLRAAIAALERRHGFLQGIEFELLAKYPEHRTGDHRPRPKVPARVAERFPVYDALVAEAVLRGIA